MKIIVAGYGNVGSTIAKQLSREGHDLTVIDINEKTIHEASVTFDTMAIVGSASSLQVLQDAGIKDADIFIAVTDSDERNLLACLVARKAGAKSTIARVRNPELGEEINLIKDELKLSLVVNPELYAAEEIARLLRFPAAIEIDTFAKGRVELIKVEVTKESPICGVALKNMSRVVDSKVLICIVERGNEVMIPTGDFTLWEDDKVSFVAAPKKSVEFLKGAKLNQNRAKTCMIVGGGVTAIYLAEKLISTGVEVKIIEKTKQRCDFLAERLPEAIVIYGDGADKELLFEEGVDRMDGFVSLTNHDEENVMMSIFIKKVNPRCKVITKVHRNAYDDIINDLDIGSIINPKMLSGEFIVKYVRSHSNIKTNKVEALYMINQGKAEAIQFKVPENAKIAGKPLMELSIKEKVIIASIIRNGKSETPDGRSVIHKDDSVVIVTTVTGFDEIDDILK